MSNLKAVLLDAGGTLFQVERPVGDVYAEYAARYGRMVDPVALEDRFHQLFGIRSAAVHGASLGSTPEQERAWWKDLVRELFEPEGVPEFDRFFDDLHRHFAKPDLWSPFPEVRATLGRLKSAGLRLAIVSNWDARLEELCRRMGLEAIIDVVVASAMVGVSKPDERIFRIVLDRLGIRPEDAAHVGDSLRDDVAGAAGAGVRPVWLRRGHASRDPGVECAIRAPFAVATSLSEAADILLADG